MKRKLQFLKTLLVAVGLSVGSMSAWGADDIPLSLTSSYSVENYSKAFYVNFKTKTIDDGTEFATAFTYSDFTQSSERGLQNTGSGTRTFTFTKNLTKGQLIIVEAGQTSTYGMTLTFGSTVVNPIKNDGYYAFYVTEDVTTSVTVSVGRLNYLLAMQVLTPSNDTYIVNAVKSDGTILKQIATGSYSADGPIYYPVCVEKDGVYYRKDSNGGSGSSIWWGFTNVAAGLRNVVYTATDYAYYSEVEDMTFNKNGSGFSELRTDKATTYNRYSGGVARNLYAKQMVYSSALSAGVYKVTLYARNGGSGERSGISLKLRNTSGEYGDEVASFGTWTSSECAEKTVYAYVPEGYSVCVYESTGNNSDIQIDYVYAVKLYDVTDPSKIIGAVDYSTAYASSIGGTIHKALSISKGETLNINFNNHGNGENNYNNWALQIVNSTASFDRTLSAGNHINGTDAYTDVTQLFELDGAVASFEDFMADYKTQMMDANVDMTITYTPAGMFSVVAEATGDVHTYKYTMTYGVAFTDDVEMKLGVDCAWIEVLSEQRYVSATLDAQGYATFASPYALDVTSMTATSGTVTAYKAAVSETTVNFTALDQTIPANTGVLLKGDASATVTIPVVATGTAVSENAFLVNEDGTTFAGDGDYYYFAMKKNSNPLTFAAFDPNTLAFPATKAYLKVLKSNFSTPAPTLTVTFDGGNTTGINTVKSSQLTENGEYYNLAGQRVSQPTKGLYIVNGRKVVVK